MFSSVAAAACVGDWLDGRERVLEEALVARHLLQAEANLGQIPSQSHASVQGTRSCGRSFSILTEAARTCARAQACRAHAVEQCVCSAEALNSPGTSLVLARLHAALTALVHLRELAQRGVELHRHGLARLDEHALEACAGAVRCDAASQRDSADSSSQGTAARVGPQASLFKSLDS